MRFKAYRLAGSLLCIIIVSACSPQQHSKKSTKVIAGDGVLNIDVLAGSFLTDDCGMTFESKDVSDFACVAFPFASKQEKGKNWDREYLSNLDADGWKLVGGQGNAYYLEKIATPTCNHSMGMIGWLQGTEEQIEQYMKTGDLSGIENQTFIFVIEPELKCDDMRQVK